MLKTRINITKLLMECLLFLCIVIMIAPYALGKDMAELLSLRTNAFARGLAQIFNLELAKVDYTYDELKSTAAKPDRTCAQSSGN
ncbi:MAG: hypothetical protein K2X27_09325 [Candidatus Obscuribacterales bacterium]|nr:hypothetical protein [Candidatus Obscuribacterales bacterium]